MPLDSVTLNNYSQVDNTKSRLAFHDSDRPIKTTAFKDKIVAFVEGRYRTENQEIKTQFKKVLSAKYGDTIASQIASEYGLNNNKALSGRTVQQALGKATQLQNAKNQILITKYADPEKSGELVKIANDLIEKNPKLAALKLNKDGIASSEPRALAHAALTEKIVQDAVVKLAARNSKSYYAEGQHGSVVLSESNLRRQIEVSLEKVLGDPNVANKLQQQIDVEVGFTHTSLMATAKELLQSTDDNLAAELLDHHRPMLKKLKESLISQANDENSKLTPDNIKSTIKESLIAVVLNPPAFDMESALQAKLDVLSRLYDAEKGTLKEYNSVNDAINKFQPADLKSRVVPNLPKGVENFQQEIIANAKQDAKIVDGADPTKGKPERLPAVSQKEIGGYLRNAKVDFNDEVGTLSRVAKEVGKLGKGERLKPLATQANQIAKYMQSEIGLKKGSKFSDDLCSIFQQAALLGALHDSKITKGTDIARHLGDFQAKLQDLPAIAKDRLALSTDGEIRQAMALALNLSFESAEVTTLLGAIHNASDISTSNQMVGPFGLLKLKMPATITHGGESYSFSKTLGEGGSGLTALYVSATGKTMVAKRLGGMGGLTELASEATIHRLISAEGQAYVPQLYGAVKIGPEDAVLLMETAAFGDSSSFGKSVLPAAIKEGLIDNSTMQLVRTLMAKELLEGLDYLQSRQQIIHADLKPKNVFMGADGKLKIGDFGGGNLEQKVNNDEIATTKDFASPEVALNTAAITEKHDQFSVGIMISELFGGPGAKFFSQGLDSGSTADQYRGQWGRSDAVGIHQPGKNRDGETSSTGVTAVDRLVNALSAPKPADRIAPSKALEMSLFQQPALQDPKLVTLKQKLAEWNRAAAKAKAETDPKARQDLEQVALAFADDIKKLAKEIGA